MKKTILGFAFNLLCMVMATISAEEYPMDQLKYVADGLNIEGGTIYHKYLKSDQIWANLCVVLDRPFEDGIEWQELTDSNSFPLKEAAILDYNESQVNYAYATIMHYYITHAHRFLKRAPDQIAKILIQVHRNTSGPRHVELLEQLLCQCYPELEKVKSTKNALKSKHELFSYFFPDQYLQVDFCYGTAPENLGELGKYNEVDIVLSFSLVGGLNAGWKSGSLLIPNQHIPFYLNNGYMAFEKRYFVQNHLNYVLADILKSQNEAVLQKVNDSFYSKNSQKSKNQAKKFAREDFKSATLLQVDGNFNPSQLPSLFKLNIFGE
jgi:hypothetical protein